MKVWYFMSSQTDSWGDWFAEIWWGNIKAAWTHRPCLQNMSYIPYSCIFILRSSFTCCSWTKLKLVGENKIASVCTYLYLASHIGKPGKEQCWFALIGPHAGQIRFWHMVPWQKATVTDRVRTGTMLACSHPWGSRKSHPFLPIILSAMHRLITIISEIHTVH